MDMSEGMLARARARSSQVRWLRGPAEQLPFADGSLDAVVTTSAFQFFDQRVALGEFHRVLAPGGLVAVTTISPPQNLPLHRLVGNRLNPEHNPSPSEMQALFESAGFSVRETTPHPPARMDKAGLGPDHGRDQALTRHSSCYAVLSTSA